eukprot:GHVS01072004.1.p1 GENE.GHVS01072004.1~~GHVS01072004.1.p1  ORF type:complete len:103 (-),score=13.59 GHVS01072004.1:97-405(-)
MRCIYAVVICSLSAVIVWSLSAAIVWSLYVVVCLLYAMVSVWHFPTVIIVGFLFISPLQVYVVFVVLSNGCSPKRLYGGGNAIFCVMYSCAFMHAVGMYVCD